MRAVRIPAASARVSRTLVDAVAEASSIIREAEKRKREVWAQGFELGRQQGLAEATRQMAAALSGVARIRAEASDRLVRLASRMAERVVGEAVRRNPDVVVEVARQALAKVQWCRDFVLRVNPADYEEINRRRPELVAAVDAVNELRIESDAQVDRGGCLLETEAGQVDALLETQLKALEQALLQDIDAAEGPPGTPTEKP